MDAIFQDVQTFPDPIFQEQFYSLVGLDDVKETLLKEAQIMLSANSLDEWSKKHHSKNLAIVDRFKKRPPLFIFSGDVGTGKTALAQSIGDQIARQLSHSVYLYSLSLNSRGSGAVGEMTGLISAAFNEIKNESSSSNSKKSFVLLIDEADALAQSRELDQMHHEDRAGVNALIRGIDDLALNRSPVLIIMCTNRLDAIDPAVQRRAARITHFKRPNSEQRVKILTDTLADVGISADQISDLSNLLGESPDRKYGYTYSDITQKLFPAIVLQAFPDKPILFDDIRNVVQKISPTPPFGLRNGRNPSNS
ncbi:MAG: ATP-binding protein [Verrucomicrobiota bacterium]